MFPSVHPWPRSFITDMPLHQMQDAVAAIHDDLDCTSPRERAKWDGIVETGHRMMDKFGPLAMQRIPSLFTSSVIFESGPIIHHHREIIHSGVVQQSQQPQVIVVNNGVPEVQNQSGQQGQSTRGAATTGAMTVNTREIKDLEAEKRRMKQELEKSKHRREIEDLRRQVEDQDRSSSSSRPSGYTNYSSQPTRALPPSTSTSYSQPTQTSTSFAPTRIDTRPPNLYWYLGLARRDNPTLSEIHTAYTKCYKDHHPDQSYHKSESEKARSRERMREIMLAKSVLMDREERKRAYDEDSVVGEGEFREWQRKKQTAGGRTFVAGRR